MTQSFALLRTRRFLPLLLTQLTSAFADNQFKTAFTIFATYRLPLTATEAGILGAVAAASVVLPFVLFSANAGQMADSIERSRLLRGLKWFELLIALIACVALLLGNLTSGLIALFAFGTQAALSSPVKYALMPQLLDKQELVSGNGLYEGGTFIAILAGGILGNIAAVPVWGNWTAAGILLASALAGVASSYFLPHAESPAPGTRIDWIPLQGALTVLRQTSRLSGVNLPIFGISWYWVIGAIVLSQFPAWTKQTLHAGSSVVTLFLAVFSIGVGFGAVLCGRILKGESSPRLAGPAALVIAVFVFDLWLGSPAPVATNAPLLSIFGFLQTWSGWRVTLDLAAISIAGGLFVVPLYAVVQQRSPEDQRAGMVAANNIWNAIFMTSAAAAAAAGLALGLSVPDLFAGLAAGTFLVAGLSFRYLRR